MEKYIASIIVPVYDNSTILEYFVYNLIKSVTVEKYQIIFVVDGSVDRKITELLEIVSQKYNSISYYYINKRCGYAHVNNIGRKYAKSDLLFFMNTDIFIKNNCLDTMISSLKNNQVQAVQPLLIYPQTNRVQSTGHIFGDGFNCHALKGQPIEHSLVKKSSTRQALSLALCLIPTKIFDEIDGFNEYYYNGWEGLDLTLKISQKGYRCWYEAEAQAYHIEGESRKRLRLNENQQAAHFWTYWGKKVKFDIIELFKLQISTNDKSLSYTIFDFTMNRSWINIINDLQIPYENFINKAIFSGEEKLDLFHVLSYNALVYPGPLLLLVTNFRILEDNMLWIQYRNNRNDLFLDLSGNVGKLSDVVDKS